MVWALAEGIVHAADFDVALVAKDIQTLNRWATTDARLHATALSAAAFARVTDKYWLLPHGASFGDGYGPVVVSREPMTLADLAGKRVLTPGDLTTAHLALQLAAPRAIIETKPFDRIGAAVAKGDADAGVLIHEGQLTWEENGFHNVVDLGAWWKETTGLPLPLGVVALRKDLGAEMGAEANALLKASIETGLAMRKRALEYAQGFGRGISYEDADRFVAMYVNDMTLDMGDRGRAAVAELIRRGAAAGHLPKGARVAAAPED